MAPILADSPLPEMKQQNVALKVKFTADDWLALHKVADAIAGCADGLIPKPSIHSLVIRAVRNYLQDAQRSPALKNAATSHELSDERITAERESWGNSGKHGQLS